MTDLRVLRLKTPDDCESFARNVDKTHPELAKQARRRAVELRAARYGAKSDAEREALEAIYAFEEVRSQQTGRRAYASRTWQSIKRNGILPTVERLVSRKVETVGYTALAEAGMEEFTFEAVVLRHPDAFSKEAAEQAKRRISEREV